MPLGNLDSQNIPPWHKQSLPYGGFLKTPNSAGKIPMFHRYSTGYIYIYIISYSHVYIYILFYIYIYIRLYHVASQGFRRFNSHQRASQTGWQSSTDHGNESP